MHFGGNNRRVGMRAVEVGGPVSTVELYEESRPAWGASVGLLFEITGAWVATLLMGVLLSAGVFQHVKHYEVEALTQKRQLLTLQDVRARLESDLSLGIELANNTAGQRILEEAIARDASLYAIEVFSLSGKSLFNTDRGSIDVQVAPEMLAAAQAQVNQARRQSWTVSRPGERIQGMEIQGPFGGPAGYVALSYSGERLHDAAGMRREFFVPTLVIMLLVVLFAMGGAALLFRFASGRHSEHVERIRLRRACERLVLTRERLDHGFDELQKLEERA